MLELFITSSLALAAPEQAATHSRADLDAVLRVAEAESVQYQGRCSDGPKESASDELPPPGSVIDRQAELGLLRVAEIRRMVVESYPYAKLGKDGPAYRSDDVRQAVQFYEMAFACNPGWEQRRYLDTALELVLARRKQIRDGEKRPDTAEDATLLADDEARLRQRLGALTPPKCPERAPCLRATVGPPAPSEPVRGYRARFMDVLSLRIELGGGFAGDLRVPVSGPEKPSNASAVPLVWSLAPGVRFLAGEQRRAVFGLGFRYTLLAYLEEGAHASQLAARAEIGVRAHKTWFSLHAGFEAGIQRHSRYLGSPFVGGYGSLCTWNEALCLRIGGTGTLFTRGDKVSIDAGTIAFGVDIFRVIDNRIRQEQVP